MVRCFGIAEVGDDRAGTDFQACGMRQSHGGAGNRKRFDEYFGKRLAEAERELAAFDNATAKYGLRVLHRDFRGERHVTQEERQHLMDTIEEYRAALRA